MIEMRRNPKEPTSKLIVLWGVRDSGEEKTKNSGLGQLYSNGKFNKILMELVKL